MHRFLLPGAVLGGAHVTIDAETLHHLKVLRLRVGDEILVLDGTGVICRCRLQVVGRSGAEGEVLERWHETEEVFPVRLLQGVPKGDKMALVLQKGVELGVSAFTPLLTANSVAGGEKPGRWERIVLEAARQSRRPALPRLDHLVALERALHETGEELRLMLWEGATLPLAEVLPAQRPRDCALLVGPEGGFRPDEAKLAQRYHFIPVSLGGRILRTETAGFAVAAILQHRFGDLGRSNASGRHDQE